MEHEFTPEDKENLKDGNMGRVVSVDHDKETGEIILLYQYRPSDQRDRGYPVKDVPVTIRESGRMSLPSMK